MSKPPFVLDAPAVEWPPPLTATSMLYAAAYLIAIEISELVLGISDRPAGLVAAEDQRAMEAV